MLPAPDSHLSRPPTSAGWPADRSLGTTFHLTDQIPQMKPLVGTWTGVQPQFDTRGFRAVLDGSLRLAAASRPQHAHSSRCHTKTATGDWQVLFFRVRKKGSTAEMLLKKILSSSLPALHKKSALLLVKAAVSWGRVKRLSQSSHSGTFCPPLNN